MRQCPFAMAQQSLGIQGTPQPIIADLQAHIFEVVSLLRPSGAISLKLLRQLLQERLGTTLVHRKSEIRQYAELALGPPDSPDGNTLGAPHEGVPTAATRDRRSFQLFTRLHDETCLTAAWRGVWEPLSVAAMPPSQLTRRLRSVAPLVICHAVTDRHSKTGVVDSECDPHVNKDAMTWKGMSLTTGLGAFGSACDSNCQHTNVCSAWCTSLGDDPALPHPRCFDPGGAGHGSRTLVVLMGRAWDACCTSQCAC